MKVEVIAPEKYLGDVMGDINARRGRILETVDKNNNKIIKTQVPLSEVFGYATELRSMTQGRASYNMEFDKYEPVPKNITDSIIEGKSK